MCPYDAIELQRSCEWAEKQVGRCRFNTEFCKPLWELTDRCLCPERSMCSSEWLK